MNTKYNDLFQPLQLNNGVALRNRFVLAPLTHISSNADGTISDREIPYMESRSKDVGMAITAASHVTELGQAFPGQPSIARDSDIEGLKRLAAAIKKNGPKAIIQIHHGGVQALPEYTPNGDVAGPSAMALKSFRQAHTHTAREMTETEINETIKAFGAATRRAIEAGFDGVEIHGANGYIIHQFVSPHFNKRTDQWKDPLLFALKVVDEVVNTVKEYGNEEFIIGYRFSPEEAFNPGIKMELTEELIKRLIEKPLHYLHASLMHIHGEVHEGKYEGQSRIQLLHQWVNGRMPLIGIGSIFTADEAIDALHTGVELIAMGRGLLLDHAFVSKIKEGREDEIISYFDPHHPNKHDLPDPLWQQFKAGFYPLPSKEDAK
ncbi:NADH-dependent flavin oxidoreductase [Macrococcus equipercicus]|uniref:NADH-dependent flavin oxidoreductase n=1 Tax=Macrococcus equipercicus TaxID=69967 RepID=A0A9Q9BLK0_9STAP|nr:NADH-dependent flavin oxidoreductase [Macrococcus equipercicus]UTH13773.1 NADH-dependent flavin oxidoreductase [Macrococcus equipercicus]